MLAKSQLGFPPSLAAHAASEGGERREEGREPVRSANISMQIFPLALSLSLPGSVADSKLHRASHSLGNVSVVVVGVDQGLQSESTRIEEM